MVTEYFMLISNEKGALIRLMHIGLLHLSEEYCFI